MAKLNIKKSYFGVLPDGSPVYLYTVSNEKMSFSVTDFGCTITSIILTDKNGSKVDVTAGYSSLPEMIHGHEYFGALVGRFANRIANGSFTLNGETYNLQKNDNGNTLHSGFISWDKMVWKTRKVKKNGSVGLEFTLKSPDGENGFPGNLNLKALYLLNEKNELTLDYYATTDKSTPVNITNHTYFNLKGTGTVLDQELFMDAPYVLEVDSKLIPTGKILEVKDTPFDFTQQKLIGRDFDQVKGGYDHCFCFKNADKSKELRHICTVRDPSSGRIMKVRTTLPGIQLYTGNFIKGVKGKLGHVYENQEALCLETQHYPDAVNHENFPSCILNPGEEYHETTQYVFEF